MRVDCPPCAGATVVGGDPLESTAPLLGVALGLTEGEKPGNPVIGFVPEKLGWMSTTAISNPTRAKAPANRAVRFRRSIALPPPAAPRKPYKTRTLLLYIDGIK